MVVSCHKSRNIHKYLTFVFSQTIVISGMKTNYQNGILDTTKTIVTSVTYTSLQHGIARLLFFSRQQGKKSGPPTPILEPDYNRIYELNYLYMLR